MALHAKRMKLTTRQCGKNAVLATANPALRASSTPKHIATLQLAARGSIGPSDGSRLRLVSPLQAVAGEPATAQSAGVPLSSTLAAKKRRINGLKLRLLSKLASLDRGLAANGQDVREVEELVRLLEATGGSVNLTWMEPIPGDSSVKSTMEILQGKWRLLYTSAFSTGNLGGRRPGPPAALVPSTLGQVYQVIDAQPANKYLDNIVEFIFSFPSLSNLVGSFPKGTSSQEGYSPPDQTQYEDQPSVRLTLRHEYDIKGTNTVEIVYEDTAAEFLGNPLLNQLPKFELPQLPDALKPPKTFRSATFQVVYLDDQMRVTRGDRQELRIYIKEQDVVLSEKTAGSESDE